MLSFDVVLLLQTSKRIVNSLLIDVIGRREFALHSIIGFFFPYNMLILCCSLSFIWRKHSFNTTCQLQRWVTVDFSIFSSPFILYYAWRLTYIVRMSFSQFVIASARLRKTMNEILIHHELLSSFLCQMMSSNLSQTPRQRHTRGREREREKNFLLTNDIIEEQNGKKGDRLRMTTSPLYIFPSV